MAKKNGSSKVEAKSEGGGKGSKKLLQAARAHQDTLFGAGLAGAGAEPVATVGVPVPAAESAVVTMVALAAQDAAQPGNLRAQAGIER